MPLFRPKADLTVTLDRDVVTAGEALHVRVEAGEPDSKVQGGRIELLYRNTYREETSDSDGGTSTTRTTTDVIVETAPLFEHGTAAAGSYGATFTVPADAPGSDPKAVAWAVRAVLDRRRARDAHAEAPLTVLAPAQALAPWAERAPELQGDCDVELAPSARVVRPGDRITGTITLRAPREAVSGRALRVDLRRIRFDEDDLTDQDFFEHELVTPLQLAPGEEVRAAFDVTVPAEAGPSFRAAHNEQHWYLDAVIDRPRARDQGARLEVLVVTAP